ncbi:MAG: 2-hydroxychromene-2-carboxylate isomerase [Myxococcota bacterium]
MADRALRFYFDFISPYAFLGWRQVRAFANEQGLALEVVPVLFAAMLKEYGHKGPAEIAPKRIHTWKNVVRVAASRNILISPPEAHPFNPLLALRVASAAETAGERIALADALFDLVWGGGGSIPTAETIQPQLEQRGLDGAAWLDKATTREVKDRLKTATAAAIDRGVFGVPSYVVDDEVFWGQDSLPHIIDYLEGRDPAADPSLARWLELPVGVVRS